MMPFSVEFVIFGLIACIWMTLTGRLALYLKRALDRAKVRISGYLSGDTLNRIHEYNEIRQHMVQHSHHFAFMQAASLKKRTKYFYGAVNSLLCLLMYNVVIWKQLPLCFSTVVYALLGSGVLIVTMTICVFSWWHLHRKEIQYLESIRKQANRPSVVLS